MNLLRNRFMILVLLFMREKSKDENFKSSCAQLIDDLNDAEDAYKQLID